MTTTDADPPRQAPTPASVPDAAPVDAAGERHGTPSANHAQERGGQNKDDAADDARAAGVAFGPHATDAAGTQVPQPHGRARGQTDNRAELHKAPAVRNDGVHDGSAPAVRASGRTPSAAALPGEPPTPAPETPAGVVHETPAAAARAARALQPAAALPAAASAAAPPVAGAAAPAAALAGYSPETVTFADADAGITAREAFSGSASDSGVRDGDSANERAAREPRQEAAGIARSEPPAAAPSARVLPSALAFVHGGDPALPPNPLVPGGAAAPAAPSGSNPQQSADNVSRLLQSMHVLVRNGIGEATVRLRPEHLGEVSIAVRVDGRAVSAIIRAEAPGVREWVQSQEDALRTGLAQQGLSLDRLLVQRDARQDRRDQPPPETKRPPRRQHADGRERFEITV